MKNNGLWACLSLLLIALPLCAGSKQNATFLRGTTSEVVEQAPGLLRTDDPRDFHFEWDFDRGFGDLSIPYARITSVSYTEHAGRGRGSSIALGAATLGAVPIFSKKRHHLLTIEFLDAQGARQSAVFEVNKDVVGTMLRSFEARTGKKIVYEGEEDHTSARN